MTQEEKQLLFNDLCARLLYGVKILDIPANVVGEPYLVSTTDTVEYEPVDKTNDDNWNQTLYNIKPYLRPLSSMTEEEVNEFILISDTVLWLGNKRSTCILSIEQTDWLNKNMFDYRGLIPMGLALEATKNMYKTE